MTIQNFWRTFNDNILWMNICWPAICLPAAILRTMISLAPGHSKFVKKCIDDYNRISTNRVAKPYHNWTGLPGIIPSMSLLLKNMQYIAEANAKDLKSFVWAAKAWCYNTKTPFTVNFNGNAIVCREDTIYPALVAFDNGKESQLYFRDFLIVDSKFAHHIDKLLKYLEYLKEEMIFVHDCDGSQNIHLHAKCQYEIDFNEKVVEQFDWINDRLLSHKMDVYKWFNQIKPL